MARRGLTLAELVVAAALLGLVGTLACGFLIDLFHLSARAGQRSKLQTEAMLSLRSLKGDLQRTTAANVARANLAGGGRGAGFVRLQEITGDGLRVWETSYRVYLWDKAAGTLIHKDYSPSPPLDPLRPVTPNLGAIALAPANGSEHCLCDCVTNFDVAVTGASVDVELQLAVPGRRQETLSLSSTVALRN